MIIGVDYGTWGSSIATLDRSGHPTVIPNIRGDYVTPSVVYRNPSTGEILVGTDAIEQAVVDPDNAVFYPKRNLSSQESLLKSGEAFTAENSTAAILRQLKADAEHYLGNEVCECVITCPANLKDDEKQALLNAAEKCGLKVLVLIQEPTAAGIAYGLDKSATEELLLVFDFGGGTHDVSLIRKEASLFDVLSTYGVAKLGGIHLTECIVNLILDFIEQQCGHRPDLEKDPLLRHEVLNKAEAGKISLGKQKEVPIVVSFQGQHVIKITQEQYHAAIKPLVDQAIEAMDKAIEAAGLAYKQIDRLIMVGGSSCSPYVQSRVADHTGLAPKTDLDPRYVVANGAALACAAELKREGKTATVKGHVIPSPDFLAREVMANTIGVCVCNENDPSKPLVLSELVPRNTPLPFSHTEHFMLQFDGQTRCQIECLQGEPDAPRDDCLFLCELDIDDLPPEQKRSKRIEVTVSIDRNGITTVHGRDKISGKEAVASIDYKKGVTQKAKPASI